MTSNASDSVADDKRAPMQRKVDEACARLQNFPHPGEGRVRPCGDEKARQTAQRILTLAQDILGDDVDAGPSALPEGGVSLLFGGPQDAEVVFIMPEDGAWVWTYTEAGGDDGPRIEPSEGEAGWVRALRWMAELRGL